MRGARAPGVSRHRGARCFRSGGPSVRFQLAPARTHLAAPPESSLALPCRRARTANLAGRTSCDRQWAPMKSVLTALGLGALPRLVNYWVLWNLGGTPACVACAAVLLGGPFVLALALAGILPAIGGPADPARPAVAKSVPAAAPAKPAEPPEHTALRLLASLQEEGRLVDFLTEEITGYSDEQIRAATRGIHDACAQAD